MKKIYIAGPMRGYAEFNFPAFFAAQNKFENGGWTVFNPARNDMENGFDPKGLDGASEELESVDLKAALKWDVDRIFESDAIYMLKGWEHSTGANMEHALAKALGLWIMYQ